jgi:hypothetical protein
MRLRTHVETLTTYLTMLSALVLPLLMVVWARSYMVNDRYLRVANGHALMLGISNGEMTLWHAPAARETRVSDHRARETSWGWSHRRSFQRFFGDHIWFAGFAYAKGARIPWRSSIATTGPTRAICVPLWFPALLFGVLPMRLIARNMQSSADFLAQRAAAEGLKSEARETAPAARSPVPAA